MDRFNTDSVRERASRRVVLRLVGLGRYQKRAILAVADFCILNLALWLAMSLRLGEPYWAPTWSLFVIYFVAPAIGVATFFQLGLYRLVTRFIGGQGAVLIFVAVGLSASFWALVVLVSGVTGVPRSVVILYPLLGTALVWGSRQVAGWLLSSAGIEVPARVHEKARNVLIYGAGTTGVQLLEVLRLSGTYVPVGFIDASETMWGQFVSGLKVYRPDRMAGLVQRYDVQEVMLALPKARRRERQAALRRLEALAIEVKTLPAIEDLAAGRVTVSDLRPVEADDLLGRDPVPPNPELLTHHIRGKSVLVTGAGGSIGSELVRQILRYGPRRLVLLEAAEAHLYEIETEVRDILAARRGGVADDARAPATQTIPEIAAVLGFVQDEALMCSLIRSHRIDTIYHAAAFKHVPIVEHNAIAGLRNNTFGTCALARAAIAGEVERFVLISTDKAVRPTSVMGASKRLAEMVLQAHAAERRGPTVFTMVRFGNVLDSSGSVVRRFRRQIETGGPVTVTHPEMVRYFMSIPEAAALVIQAGAMATGGEVFVLDMGEPVRIDDLARSMIRLMGLEVRDAQHPDGEIAIEYIGLRDGEKLHEELLLGENATRTEHPRIFRSHEPCLSSEKLDEALVALSAAMESDDLARVRRLLQQTVESYRTEVRQDEIRTGGTAESATAAE